MPSEFDLFTAEFGSPAMVERFADSQPLAIYGDDGMEHRLNAVIAEVEYETQENLDSGELIRVERATALVERKVLKKAGILRLGIDTQILVRGERWNWDQTSTKWGMAYVTIGLIRKPAIRKTGPYRATV